METEKRRVASFFIENVPDYGIIVGNEGEKVKVPVHLIADFEDRGLIKKKGAKDALDHDDDGKAGGSKAQTGDEIAALRAEYEAKVGKKPFNGWNADQLREKIAAAPADDDGKAGGEPVTEAQNAAEDGGVADDNTSDSGASTEDAAP